MKKLFIFSLYFLLISVVPIRAQQTSLCVKKTAKRASVEQRQEFLDKIDDLAYKLNWQKLRRILVINNNQYIPSKDEMQRIIDQRALYAPRDCARVAGTLLLPYIMFSMVAAAQVDGVFDEFFIVTGQDLERPVVFGAILCIVWSLYIMGQRMLDKQNTYGTLCDFREQLPN